MGDDIRDKARLYMVQVLPEIASVGPTAGLYTQLTGIAQNTMLISWGKAPRPNEKGPNGEPVFRADPPPGLTGCNGFVGVYASRLKLDEKGRPMGRFDLDKQCAARGKPYAWIPATSGAQPKFGDIFNLKRTHVGISLDIVGDVWNTAEAGQGGSSVGWDIIKRKRATQSGGVMRNAKGEELKGWVDIDLYLNGPVTAMPMPPWLPGWWQVPWRGQIFYYFFERPGSAKWTFKKPVSDGFAPYSCDDTASAVFDSKQELTLVWNTTGSVEKFKLKADRVMVGDWNSAEPLIATRCF